MHPAVGPDVVVAGSISAVEQRSVTSNTAPQRFEVVSSGLKTRKLSVGLSCITSRMNWPCTRVASATTPRGRHLDGVVAEVGHPQIA